MPGSGVKPQTNGMPSGRANHYTTAPRGHGMGPVAYAARSANLYLQIAYGKLCARLTIAPTLTLTTSQALSLNPNNNPPN